MCRAEPVPSLSLPFSLPLGSPLHLSTPAHGVGGLVGGDQAGCGLCLSTYCLGVASGLEGKGCALSLFPYQVPNTWGWLQYLWAPTPLEIWQRPLMATSSEMWGTQNDTDSRGYLGARGPRVLHGCSGLRRWYHRREKPGATPTGGVEAKQRGWGPGVVREVTLASSSKGLSKQHPLPAAQSLLVPGN